MSDRSRTARAERRQRGVEDELAKERADALGRTGRRLEEALASYRDALAVAGGTLPHAELERHLDRIAERLYALVVQRECAGVLVGGVERLRTAYGVPEAAVRRLGAGRSRSRSATTSRSSVR